MDIAVNNRFDNPAVALKFAGMALTASEERYYYGTLDSLQVFGEAYYTKGALDSALYFYHRPLDVSLTTRDKAESGNNYTGLATIFLDSGVRDFSAWQLANGEA